MSLADVQAQAAALRTAVAAADSKVAAAGAALAGAQARVAATATTTGAVPPGSANDVASLQAAHAAALAEQQAASAKLHELLATQLAGAGTAAAAGPAGLAAGPIGSVGLAAGPVGPVGPVHAPVGPVGPIGPAHPPVGPVGPIGPVHPPVGPVGPVHPPVGPVGPVLQTPETLLGQLDPGVPIALLPVRLETRFGTTTQGAPELRIRIFPDDIHVDSHEPELTADELAAGKRYWLAAWRGGTASDAAERAAWSELARRAGVTRAAWIVRATEPPATGRPANPVPDGTPLPVEPAFPSPPLRAAAWTRPARTEVLPDHWVALAYNGGARIAEQWSGSVIADRLSLGPDPAAAPPVPSDAAKPRLDPGLLWMTDFAAAEAAGMAVRLPLPPATTSIDRLVVLGVRTSMDAVASGQRLADLLDAHHYTRGLSFLRPGTPTNNTPTDKPGWSSEPSPEQAFDVERATVQPDADSNAATTAAALGVGLSALTHLDHAADDDQRHARSMNTVLWSPTWGYFLSEMIDPALAQQPDTINAARAHFIARVRGIGPLPALRVGNQPYGLLPATSLDRWRSAGEQAAQAQLAGQIASIIRTLRPYWLRGAASIPRVGPGQPDPDRQILQALGMSAFSSALRVRSIKGATFCMAENALLVAGDPADEQARQWQGYMSTLVLVALGWQLRPYLADCRYEADAVPLYLPPVSGAADLAARTAEAAAFLRRLHDAPIHDIQVDAGSSAAPATLLNILARHATLQEYGVQAITLQPPGGAGPSRALESEFVGLVAAQSVAATPPGGGAGAPGAGTAMIATAAEFSAARMSIPQQVSGSALLTAPIAGVTGALPAGQYIGQLVGTDPRFARLAEFRAALADLSGVDADALALLLGSTLDTASHRLDAWATSLATDRLLTLRSRKPAGTYVGAYGWVENLQAKPALTAVTSLPPGEQAPLFTDSTNAGFVHAPSLPQAAAAAVMRSANLTHAARGATNTLAVDLSSGRVRAAMRLLDGVREGQPLGALLGYQFERGLHEGHPGIELDECIAPLRSLAPLVTGKLTPTDGETAESIGARNVVDGLALSRLQRSAVQAALAAALPAPDVASKWPAVSAELDALDDAVDAVSDLLLSESVYQLVSGNPLRAGGSLDTISRGDHAPLEVEVVRTPRSGTAVTERLLLLLGLATAAAPGWQAASTPRSLAEPRLDRWCGQMLGPATGYRVRVSYGAPAASSAPVEVQLPDLHLSPLDVVMECDRPGASTLERRIGRLVTASPPPGAPSGVTADTPVTLLADRPGAWTADVKGLPELLELGRTLRELLATARVLKAGDLTPPGPTPPASWDTAELQSRSAAAVAALTAAASALQAALAAPGTPDAQLAAAAWKLADFGVSAPAPGLSHDGLVVAATTGATEAAARLRKVSDLGARPAHDDGTFDLDLLAAVFGPDLRAVPICRPPNAAALQASFAADLVAGDRTAAQTWLDRAAPARPGAGRLELALLYARALGGAAGLSFAVGQVPFVAPGPGDPKPRWVGLPFAGSPPSGPTTGLVAWAPAPLDVSTGLAGLVLDDWVEVIPSPRATTGLTFNFDAPGSRAPQSVLLAVSPDPSQPWDLATLEAVLLETIDLVRMRLVDLDALPWLGRFLPATFVADNALDATPGIHIRQLVTAGAALHAAALNAQQEGGG